jgi:hypothetical protein
MDIPSRTFALRATLRSTSISLPIFFIFASEKIGLLLVHPPNKKIEK